MENFKETSILDELLQRIQSGDYPRDEKFPSENELADYFGVPRIQVRKALLTLEDMGLLASQQGKGRFLQPKPQLIELHLDGGKSFSEKMNQAGHLLETVNIGCDRIPYDATIYRRLAAHKSDTVFCISRLRIVDGQPMAIHRSYVLASTFPSIEQDGTHITSMFAYYRQHGYDQFDSSKSTLSVTFPMQAEREHLACEQLVPLLLIESDCVAHPQKQTLEYTKISYRSDSFTYVIAGE